MLDQIEFDDLALAKRIQPNALKLLEMNENIGTPVPANVRRPIRLSLPRRLRYADSRDGLGGMPDRSPAHICGGPPKYLRQKSPERDTRF